MLIVAGVFFLHAAQALLQGVSPGASPGLSALARAFLGFYLLAIWHTLRVNRLFAWRLVVGLYGLGMVLCIVNGMAFMTYVEGWLKLLSGIVAAIMISFGWYHGLRPRLRARERFIAGQAMV